MDVELVRWPGEEDRLSELRRRAVPRLVLVASGATPPLTVDQREDWVRLPAADDDVRHRVLVLRERVRGDGTEAERRPAIDADGLLRVGGAWCPIPPVEARLVSALLERYGAVVSRDALLRAGWPEGRPDRNVLDVHIVRLRRRLVEVGLAIRTVRNRGYLLEPSTD